MFVSAPDWDTLLDVFAQEPLPDIVVPDDDDLAGGAGPYRSAPVASAKPIDFGTTLRCPTCADEMERLEFATVSRVVIDVCPAHGVWLDAGELERIIATIHPPEPTLRVPEPEPVAYKFNPAVMPDVIAALRMSAREMEREAKIQESEPPTLRRPVTRKKPLTEGIGHAIARLIRMIISRDRA
jgi:Zn-finger nucleic acid-binding protein